MRTGEQRAADADRRLRVAAGCDPTALSLTPAEGYLLSRIDGQTTWGELRLIGALPPAQIDRCLDVWLKDGVIEIADGTTTANLLDVSAEEAAEQPELETDDDFEDQKPPENEPPESERTKAPDSNTRVLQTGKVALPDVNESLEISVEIQEELRDFAGQLDQPYHTILGVPADADGRALKKAYFKLSRRFHPDRYFRKQTGDFEPLIETCFKRLLEAYELLSDPATRAEVQKSQAAAASSPPPVAAPTAAPPADAATAEQKRMSAIEARRRLRQRVGAMSGHKRMLQDRTRKAKGFFESGMTAFREERWLEAAGSVRLAIAFDPRNEAYKEEFVRVQRKAHEERSAYLLKHGEGAMEMRNYKDAFDLFEEAIHYRPFDAELAFRTAVLAWQSVDDLKKAKELAQQAVELEPESGVYRRTLGQIYAAAGLAANARRELETALRLDPKDKEAKSALRQL
jgi:curved DNA-binding protein CbpA